MKPYTISRLNKHALADRHYLLHAREAEWEEVDRQGAVLDTTGLSKLRIVCSNCGCVLTQDSSCEFIRDALRCPDCGEKFFHVSRMVRAATPAVRRVETPVERRAETPEIPLPPVSTHPRSESASVSARERKRAEAIRSYGYSDDMNPFQVFAFCLTRHYADFSPRATRQEFCRYLLILIPLIIAAVLVDLRVLRNGNAFCVIIACAITLLPTAAVLARRTHDIGRDLDRLAKSASVAAGFAILSAVIFAVSEYIVLLPVSIVVVLLLYMFIALPICIFRALFYDSQHGTNKYGPSYKYPD